MQYVDTFEKKGVINKCQVLTKVLLLTLLPGLAAMVMLKTTYFYSLHRHSCQFVKHAVFRALQIKIID